MWFKVPDYPTPRDHWEDEEVLTWSYFTPLAVPSILHTNREARSEGLKHYTLDFGIKGGPSDHDDDFVFLESGPNIYVNWTVDTMCLFPKGDVFVEGRREPYAQHFISLCNQRGLQNLAYCALNKHTGEYWTPGSESCIYLLSDICLEVPTLRRIVMFQTVDANALRNGLRRSTQKMDFSKRRSQDLPALDQILVDDVLVDVWNLECTRTSLLKDVFEENLHNGTVADDGTITLDDPQAVLPGWVDGIRLMELRV